MPTEPSFISRPCPPSPDRCTSSPHAMSNNSPAALPPETPSPDNCNPLPKAISKTASTSRPPDQATPVRYAHSVHKTAPPPQTFHPATAAAPARPLASPDPCRSALYMVAWRSPAAPTGPSPLHPGEEGRGTCCHYQTPAPPRSAHLYQRESARAL